jgi:hypothetical protein
MELGNAALRPSARGRAQPELERPSPRPDGAGPAPWQLEEARLLGPELSSPHLQPTWSSLPPDGLPIPHMIPDSPVGMAAASDRGPGAVAEATEPPGKLSPFAILPTNISRQLMEAQPSGVAQTAYNPFTHAHGRANLAAQPVSPPPAPHPADAASAPRAAAGNGHAHAHGRGLSVQFAVAGTAVTSPAELQTSPTTDGGPSATSSPHTVAYGATPPAKRLSNQGERASHPALKRLGGGGQQPGSAASSAASTPLRSGREGKSPPSLMVRWAWPSQAAMQRTALCACVCYWSRVVCWAGPGQSRGA